MWERKTLKEKALQCFKANYWKCVLVALVLGLAIGGGGGGSSVNNSLDKEDVQKIKEVFQGSNASSIGNSVDSLTNEIKNDSTISNSDLAAIAVTSAVVIGIIVLVVVVIGLCVSILVLNPLQVGCRKFFIENIDEAADFKHMGFSFGKNYKSIIKTMFFKDLYVFLWSLLLVIPGIIKAYEYMMVPYLLAEDPTMDTDAVLAKSKEMMDGNKWNAFVLQLSFIGWEILSLCTCGILGLFYVNPYVYQTEAMLYYVLANKSTPVVDSYETYVEM